MSRRSAVAAASAAVALAAAIAHLASCQVLLDFGEPIASAGDGGGLDCDGAPATFHLDQDHDGYGDPDQAMTVCSAPAGYVEDGTDCDDGDENVHPGALDVCNLIDDDCNQTPDDGACAVGCSDGTREGLTAATSVAACSGGFSLPGVLDPAAGPACGRAAGNDAADPAGAGCRAADLCVAGWHVCETAAEVQTLGGANACDGLGAGLFFVTRQSGPGTAECGAGANDLFGCGTIGLGTAASCAPLDATSSDLCSALGAPWSCGADGTQEAVNVTKSGPDGGGVLCCRDP